MKSPYTGKEMELRNKVVTLSFRKEEFGCVFHYYYCADMREEFEDERLSVLNLHQVSDQYREKHNIPFPEQIRVIREMYGLSAARISEILGLGINTWRLYENGEMPTIANARLIQLISDPANFMKHIREFGNVPDKLTEKITRQLQQQSVNDNHYFEDRLRGLTPTRINGYTLYNRVKTEQIIRFFAKQLAPYKTALNKLLFYTDFLHFKRTGRSITGLQYAAIDLGPVPDHYNSLYEMIADRGIIQIEGIMTDYGYTERIVTGNSATNENPAFTEEEKKTLSEIMERFKKLTTREIVELSHQEKAWLNNYPNRSLISYFDAFSLKAV